MGHTVLLLGDQTRTAFTCSIAGRPESAQVKEQWGALVTLSVRHAFESRPVTLVTVTPMEWSIAHSLPDSRHLRTGTGHFLVNQIARPSDEVLDEVAESEDFRRGLLWLFAGVPAKEDRLLAIVSEVDVLSAEPVTSGEALFLLDDGRRVRWLHPGRDAGGLRAALSAAAHDFGWRVSKEPT